MSIGHTRRQAKAAVRVGGMGDAAAVLTCKHCGSPYPRAGGRSGRQKEFCSKACRYKAQWAKRKAVLGGPMAAGHVRPPNPKPEPAPPAGETDRRSADGHPATSERIYTDEETAVLAAVEEYRRKRKRQFPSVCEILGILKGLGYARAADAGKPAGNATG